MSEIQQSKKISVSLVLGWIFGILFALAGISSIFSEPIQGIVMLTIAAVIFPPVNKLVDERWHFCLSSGNIIQRADRTNQLVSPAFN